MEGERAGEEAGVGAYAHPIDPMIDCVFKAVLGSEARKGVLIHFLNAVLGLEAPVVEVTLLDPASGRTRVDEKQTVVDVRAVDAAGRTFQVAVQLVVHRALAERMLHNWATLYHQQLSKGEDFDALRPVYAIWLLRGRLIKDSTRHHHCFEAWDRGRGVRLSEHLQLHVLETSKWAPPEDVGAYDDEDRWMAFFEEGRRWTEHPVDVLPPTEPWREVMSVLKGFSEDERARHRYEKRLEAQRVQATIERSAAKARADLEAAQQALEVTRQQTEAAQQELEAAQQQAEAAKEQAEAAKEQAEAAKAQAEAAKAQAGQEAQRADAAQQRADVLAAKLRALGIDPDGLEG